MPIEVKEDQRHSNVFNKEKKKQRQISGLGWPNNMFFVSNIAIWVWDHRFSSIVPFANRLFWEPFFDPQP